MYSFFGLLGLALSGILLHNVIDIYNINKDPAKGNFSLKSYWKTEWATILISLMISILACFLRAELAKVPYVKDYVGFAYVAIGYLGQVFFIALMGKAKKVIDDKLGS